ncbi:MAG TPA: DUF6508 domain-containing protein [Candidatus Krumholzibacteriaceae bacterium]|nr:DUF6508 domain-containing protein [Candidatus Krumholzibacteriaceae bacterium]
MSNKANPISESGIEKLLSIIPLLEDYTGQWIEHHFEKEEDVLSIGGASYAEPLMAFMHAFYESGLLISFDWTNWQEEATRIYKDPGLIERADLETIRRLLTMHIRKERFCEGHLASVCESGHIVLILKRLKELWLLGDIPVE